MRSRWPLRWLSLTTAHQQIHLQSCLKHSTWMSLTEIELSSVMGPNSNWDPMTSEDVCGDILDSGVIPTWRCFPLTDRQPAGIVSIPFHFIAGSLLMSSVALIQHSGASSIFYESLCCLAYHAWPGLALQQNEDRLHTVVFSIVCLRHCSTLPWPAR